LKRNGFSIVELLITLGIVALIAVFAIPKFFSPSDSMSDNLTGRARRLALAVDLAYEQYRSTHSDSEVATVTPGAITPYLNYVSVDTTSTVDDANPPRTTVSCTNSICLKLHDGGTLWVETLNCSFNNSNFGALKFQYDPDGKASSVTGLCMLLYRDGTVLTRGTGRTGTKTCGSAALLDPSYDPTWFTGF
jgi:prepilin-type N-terminal cleavage/methylation domain-containing protein